MTAVHSRRSIVTGLAAAPVLGLPAAAGFTADHPDAELLRAGAEFDRLVLLFRDAQERSRPQWEALQRAYRSFPRPSTEAMYIEAGRQAEREYPIAYPTCDDCTEMMDEPYRIIVTTPAKTREGMAVKARVVRWDHDRAWDGRQLEDLACAEQSVRALVEAVEAMAVAS